MNSPNNKWSASEIIAHLSRSEEAGKFLEELGIAKAEVLEIVKHYKASDDREGLIFERKRDR